MMIMNIKTLLLISLIATSLAGCIGCYNPTGCNKDSSPYYVTTTTTQIRGITVPNATKLKYKSKNSFQKDQQQHPLNEKDLTSIELPPNTAINWGGMPSYLFINFFNSEIKGYSIYPVKELKPQTENSFVKLWKSCDSALDVTLKNPNDWSFNPENMEVTGCSVNIQKRSQYNNHWPNQDEADKFLLDINRALQKLPKQKTYPVIQYSTEEQ